MFDAGLDGAQRLTSLNNSILRATGNLGAAARVAPAIEDETVSSSGTAFFINAEGGALTNAHVIDNCRSISAVLTDGRRVIAELLTSDRANDLALVRVDTKVSRFARFRAGSPVRQGDQIAVYGYPLAGALASKGNLTNGMVSALAGLGDGTRMLQVSAPVQPGSSGGPVIDMSGNVVGVVQSKLDALITARATGDIPQNVNFVIKSNIAVTFLRSNNVSYASGSGRAAKSLANLADAARNYTIRIECR